MGIKERSGAVSVESAEGEAFRMAFTRAPIGMAIVNGLGRITMANDALARITGIAARELVGRSMLALIDPDDRDEDTANRPRLFAGKLSGYDTRLRIRCAGGTSVWVALTVSGDGQMPPSSLIYQVQDISERRVLEGRLEHLIDHDFLTGLFNRRRLEQELHQEIARQRRSAPRAAVLMLDLDGFKAVNDRFGHGMGDQLLRGLAEALHARCRETDVLARLSGDEFAVLMPDTDREEAAVVATDVINLVRRHRASLGGEVAHVTASVGVALFDDLDDGQVLALADAAMYAAKQSGGDQLVIFSADDQGTASRSVSEANGLRRALSDHRFVLHCQPIWNFAESRIEQYELLIRMRGDAPGELIAPNAFLYAAERFGLIGAIDTWVISQAVALIRDQQQRGRRIVLAVNLSGRSIDDPRLASHIERELDASGIDPSSLVFELTETAAISNVQAAQRLSQRLHHRGCRLSLDDFGAGCASFSYLKNLQFDYIKIDGDFIRGLTEHPIDQLVVSAIVAIAKGMGKQTIAEFVTDQKTSDLLRSQGVDHAQGYHISRPLPVEDVLAALELTSEGGPALST
jgi:diguanylate cyclase (GGDEF)-like protein/PAS domain S-box-containing protein